MDRREVEVSKQSIEVSVEKNAVEAHTIVFYLDKIDFNREAIVFYRREATFDQG